MLIGFDNFLDMVKTKENIVPVLFLKENGRSYAFH
jgi:hypothetical protein